MKILALLVFAFTMFAPAPAEREKKVIKGKKEDYVKAGTMMVVSKGVVNTERVIAICRQLKLDVEFVDAPIIVCSWKRADLDIVLAYFERRIDIIEFVEPDIKLAPAK